MSCCTLLKLRLEKGRERREKETRERQESSQILLLNDSSIISNLTPNLYLFGGSKTQTLIPFTLGALQINP